MTKGGIMTQKKNNKKSNRGPKPSILVQNMLCVSAGGRCQICNKKVLNDNVHCKVINQANVAHIVASSKNGPRGSDKSFELSKEIGNLMYLCLDCHKFVDENPSFYTVEKLREIKRE